MPIRPQFETYQKPGLPNQKENPPEIFQSQDLLGGLITEGHPAVIPLNALQNLKNVTFIKNQLFKRNGLQPYSVAKPDSNQVMALFAYFERATGANFFRFTKSSVYKSESTGWVAFTGGSLTGGIKDLYSFAVADNRAFFSNGGADVIQELLPGTNTIAALGDAPRYKYITSAFDRIVGAFLKDSPDVSTQVGWSGALNYGEWNPVTDISAGFQNIVNSPSDVSDQITGLFYLGNVLVLPRERSIWTGSNLPSATQPFYWELKVPRIGADCPGAINLVERNALIFYNFVSSTAYYWPLVGQYGEAGQPIEISGQITRRLKNDIPDPSSVFSSYNSDSKIWSLFINTGSSLIKCYSYNFKTQNWVYDEFYNVSTVSDIEFASSTVTIDGLTGIISNLAGIIDSLGGIVANANRFFGFSNGDLATQPLFSGEDTVDIVQTDNGVAIPTIVDSKTFTIPSYDAIYQTVSIEFTPFSVGSLQILYSKDNGKTFNTYKTITITSQMLQKSQTILIKRPKRSRKLFFRLSSSDAMFSFDNYTVVADKAGLTSTTSG